jgi:uncharacterized protein
MLVPDLLEEGLLLFNQAKFYEAHEVWEDLWRATTEPSQRACCQGLIQAAVGLHHLSRGNKTGAQSQLQKSIRNLQAGGSVTLGLDIPNLIRDLSVILQTMPEHGPRSARIARLK